MAVRRLGSRRDRARTRRRGALGAAIVALAAIPPAAAVPKAATCNASAVHYARIGVGIPWVATTNSAFRGHLFYWSSTSWGRARSRRARIFTTKVHRSVNPKVLWVALHPATRSISIRGTRLDASGSFTARYPTAGDNQFPSYVEVPTAGCWRVTVSSGVLRGSVTFVATDTA